MFKTVISTLLLSTILASVTPLYAAIFNETVRADMSTCSPLFIPHATRIGTTWGGSVKYAKYRIDHSFCNDYQGQPQLKANYETNWVKINSPTNEAWLYNRGGKLDK
jgi:hypothetical protein